MSSPRSGSAKKAGQKRPGGKSAMASDHAGELSARRLDAAAVHEILEIRYPKARCALSFHTPLELLVATVLSAQSTDKRVNQVTPTLFVKYPDARAYAEANREELEAIIRPLGFFRVKADALHGIGMVLTERYDGRVPGDFESLIALPGVGRKTAHVVMGNAFGIPGITVDTHVGRVARRLGWTDSQAPDRVEADIAALFPATDWTMLSHRVIFHGRTICHARRPACEACPLAELCPGRQPFDPDAPGRVVEQD